MSKKIRVAFVCLGNICRSPTAEAVFIDQVERAGLTPLFDIDSAGTGSWHQGERAHADTRAEAKRHGIEIVSRARQFVESDFQHFDYILAMDKSNLSNLAKLTDDTEGLAKLTLFRDFDPASPKGSEMPDPYLEGGFDGVFRLCEAASTGLLAHLREKHQLS